MPLCTRNISEINRPVDRAVTRSSLERDLRFKSRAGQIETVLPTVLHRCDISSKRAVLSGRYDAEMNPANSLHALAHYSEYKKRFDEPEI